TGGAGAAIAAVAIGSIVAGAAGGALTGAALGERVVGSTCSAIATGAPDTWIGGERRNAARAGCDVAGHGRAVIAQGSATVFVNGFMLARQGDRCRCG